MMAFLGSFERPWAVVLHTSGISFVLLWTACSCSPSNDGKKAAAQFQDVGVQTEIRYGHTGLTCHLGAWTFEDVPRRSLNQPHRELMLRSVRPLFHLSEALKEVAAVEKRQQGNTFNSVAVKFRNLS